MNSNELRIENYVYRKFLNPDPKGENIGHTVCQVKAIGIENIHTSEKIGRNGIIKGLYDNLEPIPLTEEWLLKFGFEKETSHVSESHPWCDYVKEDVVISLPYYEFNFESSAIEIKSVHQLQNLHFALTGKELQCLS